MYKTGQKYPMMIKTKNILIIEDSLAIASLIQEFLKKLGYQNIHISDTGKGGIAVFEDLVNSNHLPIVLLDYGLPDMSGSEVMNTILSIRPNTKVIIESASEKADETIKDLLRHGAYQYLEKPIRFENLKTAMQVLEEEDRILENTPVEAKNQIVPLLSSSVRISLARIAEYCKMPKEDVMTYIHNMISDGKVISLGDIKEISCVQCGSVKITQTFHCPSCNGTNFKQGKLIEHFKCGNVSLEETYKNNLCPKCHKEIKTIGVDYKSMENYYVCDDCNEKFAELAYTYLCMRCNNKFKLEDAKWTSSEGFKMIST
jgi:response regulator of citrate/malate metabolism